MSEIIKRAACVILFLPTVCRDSLMSLGLDINASLAYQVRHPTPFLFPFFPQAVLAKIPQFQLLGTSEEKPSSGGGAEHKHHQLQWLPQRAMQTHKTLLLYKEIIELKKKIIKGTIQIGAFVNVKATH